MQLTALPPVTLRDLVAANEQSATRTPGLHLTDIVRAILQRLDPKRFAKDFPTGASENWQEAGFIWEDVLTRALAARIDHDGEQRFRPGEITRDGIIGSPDGVCLAPDGMVRVEEYKCTWKSARSFDLYDKKYLWWLLQIQGYCAMLDTTEADLHVLHINGDYTGYIPQVSAWRLVFTPRELAEQWQSFLNTAKREGLL